MTAPCPRCGAPHQIGARHCDACGSALGEPSARWPRALGAAALTVLISMAGAWAIYEIHRTMPAVPPGFERLERVAAVEPPAAPAPDAARSQEPAQARAPTPAPTPVAAALTAAPVARSGERLAAIQQSRCGDQTLLARIVCNERMRLRYCRDRWNEHPDCEVNSPPSTGN